MKNRTRCLIALIMCQALFVSSAVAQVPVGIDADKVKEDAAKKALEAKKVLEAKKAKTKAIQQAQKDGKKKAQQRKVSAQYNARTIHVRKRAKIQAENRFKAKFFQTDQNKKTKTVAKDVKYFVPETDDGLQLNYEKISTCVTPGLPRKHGIKIQCDQKTKVCLVAENILFKEMPAKDGTKKPTLVPTSREPDNLNYGCHYGTPSDLEKLKQRGFTLKAAKLEAPYGYKRDRLGRSLQTHFDLRSRLLLGVYYTGTFDDGLTNSLTVETKSSYEEWSSYDKRRHRYRFLEGQLTLAPFTARATVFEYDYGRQGDEPLFFIGNMIGTPSRHDVHINLGVGLTLGRLDYQTIDDKKIAFIDLAEARINWEILNGLAAEDYLMIRLGGGIGTRRYSAGDTGPVYLYPELGIKGAWLMGARGLFQVTTDLSARYGYEPDTEVTWRSARANASFEWIALTISDQPLSVFVQPEYNYLDLRDGTNSISNNDFRITSGIRLSMFVDTPPEPKTLRAKASWK